MRVTAASPPTPRPVPPSSPPRTHGCDPGARARTVSGRARTALRAFQTATFDSPTSHVAHGSRFQCTAIHIGDSVPVGSSAKPVTRLAPFVTSTARSEVRAVRSVVSPHLVGLGGLLLRRTKTRPYSRPLRVHRRRRRHPYDRGPSAWRGRSICRRSLLGGNIVCRVGRRSTTETEARVSERNEE